MSTEVKELPSLYGVSVIADEYNGHTGVTLKLWRHKGDPPFRVDDYMPPGVFDKDEGFYLRDAIRELFTREEALALVDFFIKAYPHRTIELHQCRPAEWPTSRIGYGALPGGGGADHYMFDDPRAEGQPPVSVWGYFDLNDAEAGPYVDHPELEVTNLISIPGGQRRELSFTDDGIPF